MALSRHYFTTFHITFNLTKIFKTLEKSKDPKRTPHIHIFGIKPVSQFSLLKQSAFQDQPQSFNPHWKKNSQYCDKTYMAMLSFRFLLNYHLSLMRVSFFSLFSSLFPFPTSFYCLHGHFTPRFIFPG